MAFPVPPLLVWGAAYDVDLVLFSRHPDWNMHEYARMETPEGPVWVAKDAKEPELEQTLVADIADIEHWMPEIPIVRKTSPVTVTDRSTEEQLDLALTYENIAGEPVDVTYRGPWPTTEMKKRNGSTMGHSRDWLLAVLDLSHRDFGTSATLRIGGEDIRIRRILGLVPFRMVLQQVQGGLAQVEVRFIASPEGPPDESPEPDRLVGTYTVRSGAAVETDWTVREATDGLHLTQQSPMRTLDYHFLDTEGSLELVAMTVRQWDREHDATHIAISPALPDLRRPFEGQHTSRYVIDINGQAGHATGDIAVKWQDGEVRIAVQPSQPWWTTDRPMQGTVRFDGASATVRVDVVQTDRLPHPK